MTPIRPPGTRALRLARRWFGRAVAARVFEPLVADWQHDAAEAPSAAARAVAHVRGALAFTTSGLVMVARGARPTTPSAGRITRRVMTAAFLIGLVQGLSHGLQGGSDAAVVVTASCVLSVLPSIATGITRRQRRYARAWRPLLLVTTFAMLAQVMVLTKAWPSILAARPSPPPVPWVWPLAILAGGVLPGVLGIAMARACSRRTSAPELVGLLSFFPLLAWMDLLNPYGASVPVMSAVMGLVLTVWATTVINEEHTRRAHLSLRERRQTSRSAASDPEGTSAAEVGSR